MRPAPWIPRRITPGNINYDYGQGYESADPYGYDYGQGYESADPYGYDYSQGYESADPYGYDYGQGWTATEYADPNDDCGCEGNDWQGDFDPRSEG